MMGEHQKAAMMCKMPEIMLQMLAASLMMKVHM